MTTNATNPLCLTDVDAVLPAEFEILQPSDPRHDAPPALRVVRHDTTEQTYAFDTLQQYLKFVLSVSPRRLLADVSHTRYIELSAQYDRDAYFHASVTHTVAAFTRYTVMLHRMKSDEASVRFKLSRQEMKTMPQAISSIWRIASKLMDRKEPRVIRFLPFLKTSLHACWLIIDAGAAICPTFW